MKSRRRNPVCTLLVAVVFSLSACGGGGEGGEAATTLVVNYLKDSSVTPIPAPAAPTTPGAAAAAIQVLKQNGIAVLDYWCATLVFPSYTGSPGGGGC